MSQGRIQIEFESLNDNTKKYLSGLVADWANRMSSLFFLSNKYDGDLRILKVIDSSFYHIQLDLKVGSRWYYGQGVGPSLKFAMETTLESMIECRDEYETGDLRVYDKFSVTKMFKYLKAS